MAERSLRETEPVSGRKLLRRSPSSSPVLFRTLPGTTFDTHAYMHAHKTERQEQTNLCWGEAFHTAIHRVMPIPQPCGGSLLAFP